MAASAVPVASAGGEAVGMADAARELVAFRELNLIGAWPMKGRFDVIFCRNVLIYFDKPTQAAVTGRLASHLRPGGYLILGHSESAAGNGVPGLMPALPTIYQREA